MHVRSTYIFESWKFSAQRQNITRKTRQQAWNDVGKVQQAAYWAQLSNWHGLFTAWLPCCPCAPSTGLTFWSFQIKVLHKQQNIQGNSRGKKNRKWNRKKPACLLIALVLKTWLKKSKCKIFYGFKGGIHIYLITNQIPPCPGRCSFCCNLLGIFTSTTQVLSLWSGRTAKKLWNNEYWVVASNCHNITFNIQIQIHKLQANPLIWFSKSGKLWL